MAQLSHESNKCPVYLSGIQNLNQLKKYTVTEKRSITLSRKQMQGILV